MALTPFCPSHNRDRQLEIPMMFISVLVILLKNKNNQKKLIKNLKNVFPVVLKVLQSANYQDTHLTLGKGINQENWP